MVHPRTPTLRDVLRTEFALSSAGGLTFNCTSGLGTHDCGWRDQPLTHVLLPHDSSGFHCPPGELPCGHPYDILSPLEAGMENSGDAALALPLDSVLRKSASPSVLLEQVVSDRDWKAMQDLRVRVERESGVDAAGARRAVDHIRHRLPDLDGDWYLAYEEDGVAPVGGIGLFTVPTDAGRLGRLQDVDVLPRFRGRGLGNGLLDAAIRLAREKDCYALCLRADPGDWPHKWYKRRGFVEVGGWAKRRSGPG